MPEWFEWLFWVFIVTIALCWMVMLAYMALGPSRRGDEDEDKGSVVKKPKDDKSEND